MTLKIIFLLLAILPINSNLQGSVWDTITSYFKESDRPQPPSMRVLILHDVEGANLEIQGKYALYDPYTNSHITSRQVGKSRYIQANSDGLKWGEAFPGIYQIKIEPKEESTRIIIDGRQFDSPVYVYDIGGTLSAVTQVPIEVYINSIMADLQNKNLEPETLASLAIVARTNAYYQASNSKNTYWSVDAEKVGYTGVASLSLAVRNAIQQTRYMILSRTGVYEGVATPFPAEFDILTPGPGIKQGVEVSKISLEEANAMAQRGEHAAQILAKAFPNSTIMLMKYAK